MEKGISEIPKKVYIISPGGIVGMNMMIPNRKRKDVIKPVWSSFLLNVRAN